MSQVQDVGTPVLLTTTGIVSEASGSLIGFYVNSTSAGTIVLNTGGASGATTGGTAISGTITPAIGFNRWPAYCVGRLYAIIGGTLNVTFFYAAG